MFLNELLPSDYGDCKIFGWKVQPTSSIFSFSYTLSFTFWLYSIFFLSRMSATSSFGLFYAAIFNELALSYGLNY